MKHSGVMSAVLFFFISLATLGMMGYLAKQLMVPLALQYGEITWFSFILFIVMLIIGGYIIYRQPHPEWP